MSVARNVGSVRAEISVTAVRPGSGSAVQGSSGAVQAQSVATLKCGRSRTYIARGATYRRTV